MNVTIHYCDICGSQLKRFSIHKDIGTKHDYAIEVYVKQKDKDYSVIPELCPKCLAELLKEAAETLESKYTNETNKC